MSLAVALTVVWLADPGLARVQVWTCDGDVLSALIVEQYDDASPTDFDLPRGRYCVRMTVSNEYGESEWSEVAVTPSTPNAPTELQVQ